MGNQLLAVETFVLELADGLTIKGEVKSIEDGHAKPVLIISHGFRGHKDWSFWPEVSRRFAEEGYYTVSYDFSRIHAAADGRSEEQLARVSTVSQELLDLEQVAAAVRNRHLPLAEQSDPERLAILGHSRSGGTSILFAAEHEEVRAVAVWNGGGVPNQVPASGAEQESSLQALVRQAVAEDYARNESRFDVTSKFGQLKVPALLVQGDQDNERLLSQNRLLQDIAPNQHYASIAGGNHTFGAVHPYEGATQQLEEAFEVTVEFLQSVL